MATVQVGLHGGPIVQGIELVRIDRLPDQTAKVFDFASPFFNAIQSKCFRTVWSSDDNFVLSAPTGSGKTAILELAICRMINSDLYARIRPKVVYQAPTKALCSERHRDWARKFAGFGLRCQEITGDSDRAQLKHVRDADIIVTTPEKWDSLTRKWKDHKKLMELVGLFLIDEVHIVKEDRGASLEAIVSRMKTIGSHVRFVALSATIPNSDDVATWLGKDTSKPGIPAAREIFDDGFRPVRLEKFVYGYPANGSNDFQFDQTCNQRLPDVISKHSKGKPIMIFCMTRKIAEQTATFLARLWMQSPPGERHWDGPSIEPLVTDGTLRGCLCAGVAYHHAGLNEGERRAIEYGFERGEINTICCTSTLAVGVNLPCHFVIIKNTVTYQQSEGGCKEYSDLDLVQMLGRAGRPQYDRAAVAVIMTRQEKVTRYEKMVAGKQILESRLHKNLIEHLNSEIGLRTIFDVSSARRWLESTFLFVRLMRNPKHYGVSGESCALSLEARAQQICEEAFAALKDFQLITLGPCIRPTAFGDAMSRYSISFESMKVIMGLRPKAKISEILSALAQAHEFSGLRIRSGEKQMLKSINDSSTTRFPIKVDIALPAHKVSLIIQAILGGDNAHNEDKFSPNSRQFASDVASVFQHVHRFIKCVTDCQIHLQDSIAVRNALEMARSLGARTWDDSPLQMTQAEKIGPASVRKLVGAGIRSIEDLENTESQKIDMVLSRNPPFGAMVLKGLRDFPKLRVSLKMMGEAKKRAKKGVSVKVRAEVGFLNDIAPSCYRKKPINVCLLAECSNGLLLHFCRVSGQKVRFGQDVLFEASLDGPHEVISCYVSCEEIAGTLRSASLDPKVPGAMFTDPKGRPHADRPMHIHSNIDRSPNMDSKTVSNNVKSMDFTGSDIFDDDSLKDDDLIAIASDLPTEKSYDVLESSPPASRGHLSGPGKRREPIKKTSKETTVDQWRPKKLTNGKWECKHICKDRASCKHLCCREGLDKPPKAPRPAVRDTEQSSSKKHKSKPNSTMKSFVRSSKPYSSRSVSGSEEALSARPCRRPDVNSSSTTYDNDGHLFDHLDTDPSPIMPKRYRGPAARKDQSMFLGSSSSPIKTQVNDVELGSGTPARRIDRTQTTGSIEDSFLPLPKKRRITAESPLPETAFVENSNTTFNDVEPSPPPTLPVHSKHESPTCAQTEDNDLYAPWNSDAEDLFGHARPDAISINKKGQRHQSAESAEYFNGLEDDDFDVQVADSDYPPAPPEAFEPTSGQPSQSLANAGPDILAGEEDEGPLTDVVTNSDINDAYFEGLSQPRLADAEPANRNSASNDKSLESDAVVDQEEVDSWFLREFGDIVELV